ncbi:MAG: hypothetical protein ACK4TB_02065 [Gemmobacter sp.]
MNTEQTADTDLSLDEAGATISSVASDIRDAASQKLDQAISGVREKAAGARADVAGEVRDVANALRRASEELRGGSAQERTLGTIASSIADASDAIRDKDLGEILDMARKVAREHPVLFLGGAAILGFVVSRYAKATGAPTTRPKPSPRGDSRAQVSAFVDEGNPNIQAVRAAP